MQPSIYIEVNGIFVLYAGLIVIEDRGAVEAVLAGERDAYRRLVEKYHNAVFTTIFRIVGSRAEVEDLVQETFWQAYRSLKRFRGEARFSTWLLRIAANKAIDFYRRRRQEETRRLYAYTVEMEQIPASAAAPEGELLAKELRERLHCCLGRLPAHYREVLTGHYLDGYSYREMAREAGVPVKTIESRIYRARKLLRTLWTGDDQNGA